MKETDMKFIGELIDKVISNPSDEKILKEVSNAVKDLSSKFALYDYLK